MTRKEISIKRKKKKGRKRGEREKRREKGSMRYENRWGRGETERRVTEGEMKRGGKAEKGEEDRTREKNRGEWKIVRKKAETEDISNNEEGGRKYERSKMALKRERGEKEQRR